MKKELKRKIIELIATDLEAVELDFNGYATNVVAYENYPPSVEDTAHYNLSGLYYLLDHDANDKEREEAKDFYRKELDKRLKVLSYATSDGCGWVVFSRPLIRKKGMRRVKNRFIAFFGREGYVEGIYPLYTDKEGNAYIKFERGEYITPFDFYHHYLNNHTNACDCNAEYCHGWYGEVDKNFDPDFHNEEVRKEYM